MAVPFAAMATMMVMTSAFAAEVTPVKEVEPVVEVTPVKEVEPIVEVVPTKLLRS